MVVTRETDLPTDQERAEFINTLPTRLIDVLTQRATERPQDPVIYSGHRTYNYSDLVSGVEKMKSVLTDAGVGAGDRVLLIMENGFTGIGLFYAITALDAWAVLANERISQREVEVMVERAKPRLIVCAAGDKPEMHNLVPPQSVRQEDPAYGVFAIGGQNTSGEPEPLPARTDEQVAVLIFTSGTTGVPKAAMLGHKALIYQNAIVSSRRGFSPGDCPYLVAPFVHVLGFTGIFLPVVYGGGAVEVATRFDAAFAIEGIKRHRLTHIYGAPPMISALVDQVRHSLEEIDFSSLKEIFGGGAPVDQELCDRVEEVFGMKLSIGYAATECTPIAASTPAMPANPGAVGFPFYGMDVRVVDKNSVPLNSGKTGEIQCRGPNIMLGYYQDPGATQAAIDGDGWLSIGDLGFFDDDGQLHLVGRLKDLINRSGFNVYPAEVEGVLNSYPGVLQSAVVGRKVPGNEEVIAFIEPTTGAQIDVEDLADFVAERLAPYKKPKRIELLSRLPVGPTGKISKIELRALAE